MRGLVKALQLNLQSDTAAYNLPLAVWAVVGVGMWVAVFGFLACSAVSRLRLRKARRQLQAERCRNDAEW